MSDDYQRGYRAGVEAAIDTLLQTRVAARDYRGHSLITSIHRRMFALLPAAPPTAPSREELAAAPDGWVRVEDRLPEEDGQPLIIAIVGPCGERSVSIGVYYGRGAWVDTEGGAWNWPVTHWRSLPQPSAGEERDG